MMLIAAISQRRPPQLQLDLPISAVRAHYGDDLQPSIDDGYSVSSASDGRNVYNDVFLKFSKGSHRLILIQLKLDEQRACDRLTARMFRSYGKPIRQNLISRHMWELWKLKDRPGYVSYTADFSNEEMTCSKQYQFGLGEE